MSASQTDIAQNRTRTLPHVIAVTSGKGGVGKTSISVNLGISLSKAGKRVCIFDADTGLANVNILLGLAPQFTLEHVLFGAKTIEDILLPGPRGLKVIPGANGISECVTLHPRQQMRLTRELARIEGEFDYLILDTAAGIADNTLDFAAAAHKTLVVITPEPTSLTDAFSLVKLLHRRRQIRQFQIVVNMAANANQAREVFRRFHAAVEKYIGVDVALLGFLLLDESLRNAVALQHPVALFPDSDPSSRSFLRLADAVQSSFEQADAEPVTGFTEFWQRQFRAQPGHSQSGATRTSAIQSSEGQTGGTQSSEGETGDGESSRAGDDGGESSAHPALAVHSVDRALGELETRLLAVLEHPDAPQAAVASLLAVAQDAFRRRFDAAPVDVAGVLDALIADADRNDGLLRELAQRLQPWLPAQIAEPMASAVFASHGSEPAGESTTLPSSSVTALARVHGYNENRFGSQPALLELLRRQADSGKSALELIDILR